MTPENMARQITMPVLRTKYQTGGGAINFAFSTPHEIASYLANYAGHSETHSAHVSQVRVWVSLRLRDLQSVSMGWLSQGTECSTKRP